jgi:hypothetical protein
VIKDRLVRSSPWVTSFSISHNSLRIGDRGFSHVITKLHQLTGPITLSCDQYVQYLLSGANPSVLNDTGGGYSLRGVGLPHTTPRPSQLTVSTFHPRAPPCLQFSHKLPKVSKFKFRGSMDAMWSSDHSSIYRDLHLRLAIANELSLAI